jgi:dimethylaniline monooxygenase (N-oxide forming)
LRDGVVEAVPEIRNVTGPRSVVFRDGKEVTDLDAIIFCTGYFQDYSLIDGAGHPADPAFAPDGFESYKKAQFRRVNQHYPRLYYGLLSERYPSSLAILGHLLTFNSSLFFVQYDLATMAIASLWSGSYPLPSKDAIQKEIDGHYELVVRTLQRQPMPYIGFRVNSKGVYEWMNRVAGTGVHDRLGTLGWSAWKFWWTDRRLCKLLMSGPDAPAVYRLFDTGRGRKPWDGARDSVERVHSELGKS